ncbi:MAG: helix-turn-helix domain-containing protein [Anaerolineae bacterium]|nr:helix-turn-helix domain-containing protein [Anaerolineae bacterium]
MDTITQIQVAWELKRVGHRVDEIAEQLGKHRATIYRWLKGIRMRGIRGYVAYFKQAKKGRRVARRRAMWCSGY